MSQNPPPPWGTPEGEPNVTPPPPGGYPQAPSGTGWSQPGGYPPPPPPGGGPQPPSDAGWNQPGSYPPPPQGGYQPPPSPGGYPPYGGGYPAPPPAGAYGSQTGSLIGWWARVGATILDGIIVGIIAFIIGEISGTRMAFDTNTANGSVSTHISGGFTGIELLVFSVYLILMLSRGGQTLGNKAVHSRVVDAQTGQPPTIGKVLIRWIVQLVLNVIIGIGPLVNYLWPLWDKRNQTLHDKAAGTLVVHT